jgi:serine/threonine-protein kinase
MATVHLGRVIGAAGFSRTVAIKRLHSERASDEEFVAMLLDEARLAGTIRHPNVVATLDVVLEQSELCVVMEYVEGDSLVRLTRREAGLARLEPSLAATLIAQVLHGLHAAHEARDANGTLLEIVHRDVSPHNILVGIDGVARVADFGVAKAAARVQHTTQDRVKGKPGYMAPEQLWQGTVDRRTDVFAASIVLWELLTGTRLYGGESVAESITRTLHRAVDSPRKFAGEVSEKLAAIVMRGLAPDPADRFATAEEMANALEEAMPQMRAKEIGGWVADTARSSLQRRAALVKAMELEASGVSIDAVDPELARMIGAANERRAESEAPTDILAMTARDKDSTLATVTSTAASPARPVAKALGWWLVTAATVALIGTLVPRGVTTQDGLVPLRVAAPRALGEAAARSLVILGPTMVPAAAAVPVATVAPRRSQPLPPRCETPYVIDAKGKKHFKVECL